MALGGVCRLVSLVHRRRTGKGVGGISGYTLFCCRDDRHNGSGIPFWSRLVKLSSHCFVVLCLCIFLFGGSDLLHYFSIEGQMGRLDFGCLLAAWICWRSECIPVGAFVRFRQLPHFFRTGVYFSSAASARSCGSPATL